MLLHGLLLALANAIPQPSHRAVVFGSALNAQIINPPHNSSQSQHVTTGNDVPIKADKVQPDTPIPGKANPGQATSRFLTLKEVDIAPRIREGSPGLWTETEIGEIAGTLAVRLWLDEAGAVVALQNESPAFTQEHWEVIEERLRTMRFEPARIDSQPVKATLRMVLDFNSRH